MNLNQRWRRGAAAAAGRHALKGRIDEKKEGGGGKGGGAPEYANDGFIMNTPWVK